MNNKKGISAIVETVLLILVIIAAVGAIAGIAVPMLKGQATKTAACLDSVDVVSATSSGVTILLKKDLAVSGISVTASNVSGATNAAFYTTSLPSLSAPSQTYAMPSGVTNPSKVIVSVQATISGSKQTCPAIETAIV